MQHSLRLEGHLLLHVVPAGHSRGRLGSQPDSRAGCSALGCPGCRRYPVHTRSTRYWAALPTQAVPRLDFLYATSPAKGC